MMTEIDHRVQAKARGLGVSASLVRLHEHHGGLCYHCGMETVLTRSANPLQATRDHLVPRSKGGRGADNLVLSCLGCNHDKGASMPDRFIRRWLGSKYEPPAASPPRPAPAIPTPPAKPLPLAESMFILTHGKKAWRDRKFPLATEGEKVERRAAREQAWEKMSRGKK